MMENSTSGAMRDIPGYEGLYAITEDGRVWSHLRGKFLKPAKHNSGRYHFVALYKDGKQKVVLIHALVAIAFLDRKPRQPVDHIDRNPANNHVSNLRLCTFSQNGGNQKLRPQNTSGFKGVTRRKDLKSKPWTAQLGVNGKCLRIGYFSDPVEAARAYDKRAKEIFGEFALTNFP